ncbi:MAG: PqqD family protein [Lachnospiraceae bacterium]|nr:PqqD family protein [Lachnospiraceae bacterium]
MKKTNKQNENYLERIPKRPDRIKWSADNEGMVTLDIENTGFFNRVAQKLFKKPKVSHVHLDKMGSFVWPLLDGEKDIVAIGVLVKEHFGDEAEPLYERLAKYFQVLDSYSFLEWKNK